MLGPADDLQLETAGIPGRLMSTHTEPDRACDYVRAPIEQRSGEGQMEDERIFHIS